MAATNRETVSIIVPVYNAKSYLDECLQSLILQTHRELQIICVNDGSTDQSQQILEGYADGDSRITLITQANAGVSSARNRGLAEASADYVMFVDADDWIEPEAVEHFLRALTPGIDFAIETSKPLSLHRPEDIAGHVLEGKRLAEFIYTSIRIEHINQPWGRMYRASRIREKSLTFREELPLGEDLVFNLEYLQDISRIVSIPGRRYHTRPTPGSLTRSFRPSKYHELMRAQDALVELIYSIEEEGGEALTNYLRIKALMSSVTNFHPKTSGLTRDEFRTRVREMQQAHPRLLIRSGDAVMRGVGLLYNTLGLHTSTWIVTRMKRLLD